MAPIGFGDIQKEVRSGVNFHFALLEKSFPAARGSESWAVSSQERALRVHPWRVVGEGKNSSSGRPEGEYRQDSVRVREMPDQNQVAEDGDVELFAFEAGRENSMQYAPSVADVAHAIGIVRDYSDAESLQRGA